jgi:hypothetical protein
MEVTRRKSAVVRALQFWKALPPMVVTALPFTFLREVKYLNGYTIFVAAAGRTRDTIRLSPVLAVPRLNSPAVPVILAMAQAVRSRETYLPAVWMAFKRFCHSAVKLSSAVSGTGLSALFPPEAAARYSAMAATGSTGIAVLAAGPLLFPAVSTATTVKV